MLQPRRERVDRSVDDYELTPLGQSLMPAVNAVKTWPEQHIGEIQASRAAYDGRTAAP